MNLNKVHVYCKKILNNRKLNKYDTKLHNVYNKTCDIKLGEWKNIVNIFADEISRLKDIPEFNNNKYVVLLLGTTGSGKSSARNIAIRHILEMNDINKNIKNKSNKIIKNFADANIDDITYRSIMNDECSSNKIKNSMNKLRKIVGITESIPIDTKITKKLISKIDKLAEKSFDIYKKYRNYALSELYIIISIIMNKNIFIESSTMNINYLTDVLNKIKFYNYKVVIMVPFVEDIDKLFIRTINRGIKEGRFISYNQLSYSNKNIKQNINKFIKNLKEVLKEFSLTFYSNNKYVYDFVYSNYEFNKLLKNNAVKKFYNSLKHN